MSNTVAGIIREDFLLDTPAARTLYHTYAERMPIIDYHCHLEPRKIAEDYVFSDLGELMLGGDHYKWRAMRAFGIEEKYITGDADGREKFRAYAGMLPYAVGNPLYAWTHLELCRYFGITEALTAESADRIFDRASAMLREPGFSARGLISRSGVRALCTTDDPQDSLEWHKSIAGSGYDVAVLPAFRPDRLLDAEKPEFAAYLSRNGIRTYDGLLAFLRASLDRFSGLGCRLSDHGLSRIPFRRGDAAAVFDKAKNGDPLSPEEAEIYQTETLLFCAGEYARRGYVMQLHFGPMRNNNTKMYRAVGPDTGFDSIGDPSSVEKLRLFLDTLERDGLLPKTVLYSLSGLDNQKLAALMGSFQTSPVRGKMQLGSGWWFNDTRSGMEHQLTTLAELGVLGTFIGMLTDSRSFVSYPRHEYFRRILCALLGRWVENGEYPRDYETLGRIVGDISYRNAASYFALEGETK